jgi:hypothetical protein
MSTAQASAANSAIDPATLRALSGLTEEPLVRLDTLRLDDEYARIERID